MIKHIRHLIAEHGRLPVSLEMIDNNQDLYAAGLTSFAAVQLMLALEDQFNIEFPERMLNRRSFATIDSIANCVGDLVPAAA